MCLRMKVLEQRDARRLRAQDGMPIAEIARTLKVAKSSVSGWVKDVRLTADQVATLREANPVLNRQMKGQATRARRARAARRAAQAHGRHPFDRSCFPRDGVGDALPNTRVA
jgi:transcriptional regulator with XRE-family HTH domain